MFIIGVLLSIYLCYVVMMSDPKDTYRVQEWTDRQTESESKEFRPIDQPLGYQYAKKMQEEKQKEKPKLYDA